jgi:hypothetical protein
MIPYIYTEHGNEIRFHYRYADLKDWLKRGKKHGDVGPALMKSWLTEAGTRMMEYKSFGTIEHPMNEMCRLTMVHICRHSMETSTLTRSLIRIPHSGYSQATLKWYFSMLPMINNIALARGTEQQMALWTGELPVHILVKVPTALYQNLFDLAQSDQGGQTEEERLRYRQARIFRALKEWTTESYPSYGIVNFIDLNRKEAEEMNHKIYHNTLGNGTTSNFRVEWGMYVLMGLGAAASLNTDITEMLTNPKQIGP